MEPKSQRRRIVLGVCLVTLVAVLWWRSRPSEFEPRILSSPVPLKFYWVDDFRRSPIIDIDLKFTRLTYPRVFHSNTSLQLDERLHCGFLAVHSKNKLRWSFQEESLFSGVSDPNLIEVPFAPTSKPIAVELRGLGKPAKIQLPGRPDGKSLAPKTYKARVGGLTILATPSQTAPTLDSTDYIIEVDAPGYMVECGPVGAHHYMDREVKPATSVRVRVPALFKGYIEGNAFKDVPARKMIAIVKANGDAEFLDASLGTPLFRIRQFTGSVSTGGWHFLALNGKWCSTRHTLPELPWQSGRHSFMGRIVTFNEVIPFSIRINPAVGLEGVAKNREY